MKELEEIYEEVGQKLYRYFYARTLNGHLAEELTQETFYQVVRSVHHFHGQSSLSTYVFSVGKNVLKKALRKQRYQEQLVDVLKTSLSKSTKPIDLELIEKWNVEMLYQLIQQLEEPQREIICLRIYGELSFGDIGSIFGKSENWARVNFQRGKIKIMKKAGEMG